MEKISLDTQVTLRQAYMIMFDYLEGHYERTGKPNELGGPGEYSWTLKTHYLRQKEVI